MSKQNRLQMNKTEPKTQENLDLTTMVNAIANDYAAMYNSAPNPIKDVLTHLLWFGEEEGVLVKTAVKKLYECNEEYKEGK